MNQGPDSCYQRGMRLLIHAAGIAGGGGLRHLMGFLPELALELSPNDEACVSVRASVASALPPLGRRIDLAVVPDALSTSPAARLFVDQIWVPWTARARAADVVVSLANFGPVAIARPHVVFQTNA